MGSWGVGLYSDDYALDLRSLISGIAKLPFKDTRLLELLRNEEICADDPDDDDHTLFWLVTADQFERKGIQCPEATKRALRIINKGLDIANLRDRGMPPGDLRQREKLLSKLADRLQNPSSRPPRKTIKKPQPLILEQGSVWCYPTDDRRPRNPYYATAEAERFQSNGWGVMSVLDCGRAFEILAWYSVAPIICKGKNKPTLDNAANGKLELVNTWDEDGNYVERIRCDVGTMSNVHFKRVAMEFLGYLQFDHTQIPKYVSENHIGSAINNISICNVLDRRGKKLKSKRVSDWLIH